MRCCIRSAGLLLGLAVLSSLARAQEEGGKFSVKSADSPPPKELSDAMRKRLGNESVQFLDGSGQLVAEVWVRKEVPTDATPEQIKNGITYRELKESTIIAVVRFDQAWHDYRKQKVKAGVYTLRLGFQPDDGDHAGKSLTKEFLVLNGAGRDTKNELLPTKMMMEMSMKTIDTSHPAVFMLFPNNKPGAAPTLESKELDHWVLFLACPVEAKGAQAKLGFGLTLVGEATE